MVGNPNEYPQLLTIDPISSNSRDIPVVFPKRRCASNPSDPVISLSQWLNFKLFGITCLVGKIKFKLLSSGSIG